ncbi:MAG: class IV adenylate cyclase [Anaerolineales bacterium]
MHARDEEIEVKFYVQQLDAVQRLVLQAGGHLLAPRTREYNVRFDTANRSLGSAGRLLRLRRDRRCYLTYKDDTRVEGGALHRREIEVGVDDFDTCLRLVEALGYETVFIYEKYRTTYACGGCSVMLDELPLGHFVEIEGGRLEIEELAGKLRLKWKCAIPRSYHALFSDMRGRGAESVRDLTFSNFAGRVVEARDLGVTPADA